MNASEPNHAATPLTPYGDLAGLAVNDADDLRAGHVYGVLTEAGTGLIRFLDVDLDGEARHVLVPIGHTRLESGPAEPRFRLRAVRLDDLRNIPSYDGDDRWQDTECASRLAAQYGRFFRGDHYYAHPAYDHSGLFAGPHPIVPEPSDRPPAPLQPLSASKYRTTRDELDVLDCDVTDTNNLVMGTAAEVLYDPQADEVRYVVLELAGHKGKRLLPIGYLEVDESRNAVHVPGLTIGDVTALPDLSGDGLTREQEQLALSSIERALDARNPFLRVDFSDREIRTQQGLS